MTFLVVVFGSVLPESPQHVGCIDPACDVETVVTDAFENARFLCDSYYLTAPSLKLECYNTISPNSRINVVAVPSHLYHIMFELLKVKKSYSLKFRKLYFLERNASYCGTYWNR